MYAIRHHEFGPADVLNYEEVPTPAPGPGQVRIAVRAAGVHLLDTTIRSGESGGPFPLPELPFIPGREVAGVVDALGAGVDESWLGKRVVGHLGMASQGYAEAAVREVEALHILPEGLDFPEAVAMIGTGRTTMGVLDVAKLTADDVVLVPAAAGGIGSLLVQYARNLGATVVGLAGGPEKTEKVRALGATHAFDYTEPDWPEQVRKALGDAPFTVFMDSIGGEVGREVLELMAVGGRVVLFGWSAGTPTEITTEMLYAKGLTASAALGPAMMKRPGGVRSLETEALAQAADGRLKPLIQTYPLAEAAAAHTALVSRGTVGKVVLLP